MKRNEHLFQFSGKQISDAAQAEHAYHTERVQWWEVEQARVKSEVEKLGVSVQEYQHSGGKRMQAVFDTTLTSRLSECGDKISSHRKAADAFQIEAACYGTQPERAYELHPDDVIYFRLAGGARAD